MIPFVIYVRSCSPWPQTWDYGEMQTVPYILGVPHATGFPAFVLAGWLFTHLFPIVTVAWQMNVLCAAFMAGSCVVVARIARAFGATAVPSFLSSLLFATTAVAWTKGSHADVHAMALFFSLLVFAFVLRFGVTRDWRYAGAASLCFGIGLAVHPNVLWSGIALAPAFASVSRRSLRRAAIVLALGIAPLSMYLYLPIRSSIVEHTGLDPAGRAPFFYEGEIDWDTNRTSTFAGFVTEVSGSEFAASNSLRSIYEFWRYPGVATLWLQNAAAQFGWFALVLAALGSASLIKTDHAGRLARFAVVAAAFAALPFAYSYPAELDLSRYVLASLAIVSALAASAANLLRAPEALKNGILSACLAATIVANYRNNAVDFGARTDRGAQPTIDAMRDSVPDNAVIISDWLDGSGLAYGAYVDGSLGNRLPLLWTSRFAKDYQAWSGRRDVFILANFAIKDQVTGLLSAACLQPVPLPAYAGNTTLYRVACRV